MKKFLRDIWDTLVEPTWTPWQLLLFILIVEFAQVAGVKEAGLISITGAAYTALTLAIGFPLAMFGSHWARRIWSVDRNEHIRQRQESNDNYRERCVEHAYKQGQAIGHTRGVADERVEWRKMKAARDQAVDSLERWVEYYHRIDPHWPAYEVTMKRVAELREVK